MVILSGGPASVYAEGAPALDSALLELGDPVLGICYGVRWSRSRSAAASKCRVGEFGRSDLR